MTNNDYKKLEKLSNGIWFPISLILTFVPACYFFFIMLNIALFDSANDWFVEQLFVGLLVMIVGISGIMAHIEVEVSNEPKVFDRLTKGFINISDLLWNWLTYSFMAIFVISLLMPLITDVSISIYRLGVMVISFVLGAAMFMANKTVTEQERCGQ